MTNVPSNKANAHVSQSQPQEIGSTLIAIAAMLSTASAINATVYGANARLAGETRSRRWVSLIGLALCLVALATLLWQTVLTAPGRISILAVMIAVAFTIELGFRLATGRTLSVFKSRRV